MIRYALIALLGLMAGTTSGNTFELSDPANEMVQEEQAREQQPPAQNPPATKPTISGDVLCSVDTDSGDCSCIDRDKAKKLSIAQEDCAALVLKSLLGREG